MFINMTKPSPVMAALAEMQGKFFFPFHLVKITLFSFLREIIECQKSQCHLMSLNIIERHCLSLNVTRHNVLCH